MKNILLIFLFLGLFSCTIDPTEYKQYVSIQSPNDYSFQQASIIEVNNFIIHIDTPNGLYYKGYNDLRIRVFEIGSNLPLDDVEVTLLPIYIPNGSEAISSPHSYNLNREQNYLKGYISFTEVGIWDLYLNITISQETVQIVEPIEVNPQENKNLGMTSFIGNDGEQYVISLISPTQPTISANDIVAGIYKYNSPISTTGSFPNPAQFSYSQVENYTLKIDPRMPEPSMGNHSSPNNEDLLQQEDGNYHGIVNYTMTGNWTLNFILLNDNDEVVKGTPVSTDFTPGIEGEKSELFIDILF